MIDKHTMHFFVKEAFVGKARKAAGDFVGNLTGSRYNKAFEKFKKLQKKAVEMDDQLDAAVQQKLKQGPNQGINRLREDTVYYSDEMEPLRRRAFLAQREADDAYREATRIGESTAKTQQAAMIAGLGTVGTAGIAGGTYAFKNRKSKKEQ